MEAHPCWSPLHAILMFAAKNLITANLECKRMTKIWAKTTNIENSCESYFYCYVPLLFFHASTKYVVKSLNFWPVTLHHTSSWSFLARQRDRKAICLALPGRLTSTLRRSLAQGLCRGRRCQSDSSRLCLAIRLAATSVVLSFTQLRQTMPP